MSEEPSDFTYSQKSLDEDAYAEADSITEWPEGSSVMPVTAGANWGPNSGEAGIVTTKSAGTAGVQTFEAYNGSEYKRAYASGVWSSWAAGGGGTPDHIVPLDLDAFVEADLITDYPEGISIMAISGGTWVGEITASAIVTERVEDYGGTQWLHPDDGGNPFVRRWSEDLSDWRDWTDVFRPVIYNVSPLDLDSFAESDPLDWYDPGLQLFPVSSGANWGPNTGQAGMVETVQAGSEGIQTFTQFSNGNRYSRAYASAAWSSWVALQ